jgi:hypothetical protein
VFPIGYDGRGRKQRQGAGTMTDLQTILKLIETVNVEETLKLDEIDARVEAFLTGCPCYLRGSEWVVEYPQGKDGDVNMSCAPRYTRSRGTLKTIRPAEYHSYAVPKRGGGFSGCCFKVSDHLLDPMFTAHLDKGSTEELAECHAIMQARAYVNGGLHDIAA